MADFNAHSNLWGCDLTDKKGEHIEDFLINNNLSLINTKSVTYISTWNREKTSLDLTISNANLFLVWMWKVQSDHCGNDHFPIILKFNTPQKALR